MTGASGLDAFAAGVVERAAPPPERSGGGAFEPVATDPAAMARRRAALVAAFGSEDALAAHAESLGVAPGAFAGRLRDVRLAGPAPDWARTFAEVAEHLCDEPGDWAAFRRWAGTQVADAWPDGLPRGPEVLKGPLDFLAARLGQAMRPTIFFERRLGGPRSWRARFRLSPALAFAIGRATADWIADMKRIVSCAGADRALIAQRIFGGADPGRLEGVEAGLGDPHAGGRSVAILRFERGAVAFKPKDLRVASAVADIVRRFGGQGMKPPELLTRGDYAWEPVYEARPLGADDDREADAFYGALGGWLALLQPLDAVDFWFDNLIAEGAVPRFIDFETAAQPPPIWLGAADPAHADAMALYETSPAAVGILPLLMPTREGAETSDIGCMARPGEHRTPIPDFEKKDAFVQWSESRYAPHHADGRPADAADRFDAFEEGYLRVARALRGPEARAGVMQALRRVGDAPVRIIRIDTWTCYRAMNRSLVPRRLSDGVWREIELHAVLNGRNSMEGEIREAAVRDLRRLDIPLFQTRLESRDLLGMEGERRNNAFAFSAIDNAGRRLEFLSGVADDERLAWLRSTFAARRGNPPRRAATGGGAPPAGADNLLAWADEIASDTVRRAVSTDRGAPQWLGRLHDVFTGWQGVGPLSHDVLSGRTGVALALAELAERLDRPGLAGLARETLAGAAREYLAHSVEALVFGGGWAIGAGGLVCALARDPELRDLAAGVWEAADAREIWMRNGADYVSGLAGWREAARALGREAPTAHGAARAYAPSALPRLARWLDPDNAPVLCADRRRAARLRRDRDLHDSWFAAEWLDDRHNHSGIDGLPALAVRLARLAADPA